MRSRKGAILSVIAFLFILSITPIRADAAKLDKTSIILMKGRTSTVKLQKYPKKTKKFAWKTTGKAVKLVSRKKATAKVKAVKYGSSVLKIRSGKKTLKCKITVVRNHSKMKLAKGTGIWELGSRVTNTYSSNTKVVKAARKGTSVKLTALGGGTASVYATTAGTVYRVTVTVPGKPEQPVKPAGKPEKPDTPTTEQPDTPWTEPETPDTPGFEEPPELEPSEWICPGCEKCIEPGYSKGTIVTIQATTRIGVLYHCNNAQHTYACFLPMFLAANKTSEEATAWLAERSEEEKALIDQKISESYYSEEFKNKLLDILQGKTEITDELKSSLVNEFLDIFGDHCFAYGCSSSSPTVYYYGEWAEVSKCRLEEWEKLYIK